MDSPHWLILSAVRDRLAAVPGLKAVRLRKKPVLLAGEDVPCVVVSGGAGEGIDFETFNQGVAYAYPVRVALVCKADGFSEEAYRAFVNLRSAVRDELFQPNLPGADSGFDARIDPDPVVQLPDGTNYDVFDVAAFTLTVLSAEARKS